MQRGSQRLLEFGLEGKALGLRLLCDAEYTYMNPGISTMVIAMAKHLNLEQPTVSNTYQCYLKVTTRRQRLITGCLSAFRVAKILGKFSSTT